MAGPMSSRQGLNRERSRLAAQIPAGLVAILSGVSLATLQAEAPPEGQLLLPQVLRTLQADRAEAERWSWIESVVLEKDAPDGAVRSRTAEVYEVFTLDGRRMRRPISLDLADDSQGFGIARREEGRFLSGETAGAAAARAVEDSPFEPDKLLRCFHFEPAGRDEMAVAANLKVAFTPVDGCLDDGSRAGRILQQLIGTIWIDEKRQDVVRIEGHLQKPVPFGFGILGKVESFEITVERQPVAPDLYMMTHVSYRARGTSFIFRQFDVQSVHDRSAFALNSRTQAKVPSTSAAP